MITVPGFAIGGALALLIALGVQTVRLSHEQAAHAETRATAANERTAAATARAQDESRQRAIEQQREKEKTDAITQATLKTDAARADLGRAVRAGDSLREQTARTLAAARGACSGATAGPAGAPASDAAGMLAELFERADERAGILAEVADLARIAGQTCEASYDSLGR